ncbi:hypothetical protein Aglo01_54220 [Actinokineospora globicatena]|uniref:Uncharacterized protein n=1 Tax=Actinokineospora globicatena TaxID=103729 RepID=A0A9W6VAZ2_9PSEU|nr:hypothetical protein Aglo01_54220 [Actinokineospora globicatena]GLW88134.1 hypothetical protein Aglo02_57730 [Actinokineospora globicatena]GLW92616.1 hypothetical protein Aglo03_34320 [Actinokineospora globicatena]
MTHPSPDDATVELPRTRARSGFWRETSGALAIGLTGLATIVLALQVIAWIRGLPGPGIGVLLGHFATAAAALAAQHFADRRQGPQAALAVLLVAISTGIAIWFFWWA